MIRLLGILLLSTANLSIQADSANDPLQFSRVLSPSGKALELQESDQNSNLLGQKLRTPGTNSLPDATPKKIAPPTNPLWDQLGRGIGPAAPNRTKAPLYRPPGLNGQSSDMYYRQYDYREQNYHQQDFREQRSYGLAIRPGIGQRLQVYPTPKPSELSHNGLNSSNPHPSIPLGQGIPQGQGNPHPSIPLGQGLGIPNQGILNQGIPQGEVIPERQGKPPVQGILQGRGIPQGHGITNPDGTVSPTPTEKSTVPSPKGKQVGPSKKLGQKKLGFQEFGKAKGVDRTPYLRQQNSLLYYTPGWQHRRFGGNGLKLDGGKTTPKSEKTDF